MAFPLTGTGSQLHPHGVPLTRSSFLTSQRPKAACRGLLPCHCSWPVPSCFHLGLRVGWGVGAAPLQHVGPGKRSYLKAPFSQKLPSPGPVLLTVVPRKVGLRGRALLPPQLPPTLKSPLEENVNKCGYGDLALHSFWVVMVREGPSCVGLWEFILQ